MRFIRLKFVLPPKRPKPSKAAPCLICGMPILRHEPAYDPPGDYLLGFAHIEHKPAPSEVADSATESLTP